LMVPEDRMVDWVTGTRFLAKPGSTDELGGLSVP
jgi:hypothetical protein